MEKRAKQARFSSKSGSFFQIYVLRTHSGCFGYYKTLPLHAKGYWRVETIRGTALPPGRAW